MEYVKRSMKYVVCGTSWQVLLGQVLRSVMEQEDQYKVYRFTDWYSIIKYGYKVSRCSVNV